MTFPDPQGSYGRLLRVLCKSSVGLFYCPGPWQQQVPSDNSLLHQRGPEIRDTKIVPSVVQPSVRGYPSLVYEVSNKNNIYSELQRVFSIIYILNA